MAHLDPTQRAVLGWPIRWVAGLLVLLFVSAGGIPGYASEVDDSRDERIGELAFDQGPITSGELRATTSEAVGTPNGSDSEVEEEASDPPAWWTNCARLSLHPRKGERAADARPVRSREAVGEPSTRAPPSA